MAIIYATIKVVLPDIGIDNGDDPIESESHAKDLIKDVLGEWLDDSKNSITIDDRSEYDKDEESEEENED